MYELVRVRSPHRLPRCLETVSSTTLLRWRECNAATHTIGATEPLASMRWHRRISCARGNDGDVHQSGQQYEYPLRDAVLRRTVRFPARAGRIGVSQRR